MDLVQIVAPFNSRMLLPSQLTSPIFSFLTCKIWRIIDSSSSDGSYENLNETTDKRETTEQLAWNCFPAEILSLLIDSDRLH